MDIFTVSTVSHNTLSLIVKINIIWVITEKIVWDGVIIIRSGLYKNGKFKFYMEFPRGFPKNKPEIYFVTKIYHPLIDSESGHLDLNVKYVLDI